MSLALFRTSLNTIINKTLEFAKGFEPICAAEFAKGFEPICASDSKSSDRCRSDDKLLPDLTV